MFHSIEPGNINTIYFKKIMGALLTKRRALQEDIDDGGSYQALNNHNISSTLTNSISV